MKITSILTTSSMFRNYICTFLVVLAVKNISYGQDYTYEVSGTYNSASIDANVASGTFLSSQEDAEIALQDKVSLADVSYVKLGVDHDTSFSYWYKYTITLEITPILSDGTDGTAYLLNGDDALSVEYNPSGPSNNYIDVTQHQIPNSNGIKIKVLSITTENLSDTSQPINTSTSPTNIYLETGFQSERYYFQSNQPTSFTSTLGTYVDENNTTVNCNCLGLSWTTIEGAISYDLEWTWVDNYGSDPENPTPLDATDIKLSNSNFERNSTRINTSNLSYQIPLIYSQGYIVYRIRAVGKFLSDPTKYNYGDWSSGITSKTYVSEWNDKTLITSHENKKNWQFQASYAEEGKKKEVVSYFDGTLRNRQTVTKINSDNNAIVGEVIYDNQGRPAIEVLPVPAGDNRLDFYPDFNLNIDNELYTHNNFDWDSADASQCEIDKDKLGMSTQNGASKYYGVLDNITNTFQDYVPDAENFPFSQIEYTPDNTGRIRRKGGVGAEHQLGSGHEMKYYYSTPSQTELTRLFGSNVGNVLHYKKNMVVDPNNQVSISYIDPQGRTIATALTGDNPPALESITSENQASQVLDVLNKKNASDTDTDLDNNIKYATSRFGNIRDGLQVSKQIAVASDASSYDIDYQILNDTPFTPQYCSTHIYPFVYNLTLSLKDDCANELLPSTVNNIIVGTESLDGTAIPVNTPSTVQDLSEVFLNTGTYTLYKNLTIDENVLNNYANDYISQLKDSSSSCYINPDGFAPEAEIEGCDLTCDECKNDLGLQNEYIEDELRSYYGSKSDFVITGNSSTGYTVDTIPQSDDDNNGTEDINQEEVEILIITFNREWELLYQACEQLEGCSVTPVLSSCSVNTALLLQDMSPLGQYGSIQDSDDTDDILTINDPLSIFNEANQLIINGVSGGTHWRSPDAYFDSYGNVAKIEVIQNADGSYIPQIQPDVTVRTVNNEDGTLKYLWVQPQDLLYVEDFLSYWEDSWAESLIEYHPENCYLEYNTQLCTLTYNDLDTDAYDSYINSITTFADAVSAGVFANEDDIYDEDPYFHNTLGTPYETNDILTWRRGIMTEAITTNYDGNANVSMWQMAYITVMCNGITTCNTPSNFSEINNLSNEKLKDRIWETYRSFYLSLKEKIKYVFINVYAKNEGCYNGCIGVEGASTLTNVIRDYAQKDNIANYINNITTPQFCDITQSSLYIEKTKQFVPIDIGYDSSLDIDDLIENTEVDTEVAVYLQTGECPLLQDLEAFLSGFVEEKNSSGIQLNITQNRVYAGQYLSSDLYEAFGGIINETSTININSNINGSSISISIPEIAVPCVNPVTLTLPASSSLSWSNYNPTIGTGWHIIGLSNLYYDNDLSDFSNGNTNYGFQILARIQDGTELKEIVLTGTTCTAIGECSTFDDGDTIGEVIDTNVSNPESKFGCTRKAKFKRDFVKLLNVLNQNNTINGTNISLNQYPAYINSILPEFFNDFTENHTATWSFSSSSYTVEVSGNITFTFNAESIDIANDHTFEYITINEGASDQISIYASDELGNIYNDTGVGLLGGGISPGLNYSCCPEDDEGPQLVPTFTFRKQISNGGITGDGTLGNRLYYKDVTVKPLGISFGLNEIIDIDFDAGSGYDNFFNSTNPEDFNFTLFLNGEEFTRENGKLAISFLENMDIHGFVHAGARNRISWNAYYPFDFEMYNLSYDYDPLVEFDFNEGTGNAFSSLGLVEMNTNENSWITDPIHGTGLKFSDQLETHWNQIDNYGLYFLKTKIKFMGDIPAPHPLYSEYNDAGFILQLDHQDSATGHLNQFVVFAERSSDIIGQDLINGLGSFSWVNENEIANVCNYDINNTGFTLPNADWTTSSISSSFEIRLPSIGYSNAAINDTSCYNHNQYGAIDSPNYGFFPEDVHPSPDGGAFMASFQYSDNGTDGLNIKVRDLEIGETYTISFYQTYLGFSDHAITNSNLSLSPAKWLVIIDRYSPNEQTLTTSDNMSFASGAKRWEYVEHTFVATDSIHDLYFAGLKANLGTPKSYIGIDGIKVTKTIDNSNVSSSNTNCLADCIPQTVAPISSDEKYNDFINFLAFNSDADPESTKINNLYFSSLPKLTTTDPNDDETLEFFRAFNYAYLVDSYIAYIEALNITSTYDKYYLTIAEFGDTNLNYGYDMIDTVVAAYVSYTGGHSETDNEEDIYWNDYVNTIYMVNNFVCPPVPMQPKQTFVIETPPVNPCESFRLSISEAYKQEAYESYLNELKEEFKREYIKQGITNVEETLTASYSDKEYQYTLYYYDQAGNLVQTVAPEGVDKLNASEIANGDQPEHTFKTQYRYNSLNQLVWQSTPDGGETRFAYDELGRIIASQNAKQIKGNPEVGFGNFFSYTQYDELGRIIEAGEVFDPVTIQNPGNNTYKRAIGDDGKLYRLVNGVYNPANIENSFPQFLDRKQITKTTYTTTSSLAQSLGFNQSTNTRNRVTSVIYIEDSSSGLDCNNAIFYDYDIHGNVKKMGYYVYLGDPSAQKTLKTTEYEYDLISGNVNQVIYQKDQPDQFIHRYQYDADNRITAVQTSRDGVLWETDASYQYYEYGPLARTVLGEQQVQGIDYAYTIQGWLKGVNGENAGVNDMGNDDGTLTAKDAFGFSLNYFSGDYTNVAGTTPFTVAESSNQNPNNLYNGNIKTMVTSLIDLNEDALSVLQNNYTYDQLNRIKTMQSYNIANSNLVYASNYTYDKNGNLTSLERDANGTPMDRLSYNYNSNQLTQNSTLRNNRLYSVDDTVAANTFEDIDIDGGQSTGVFDTQSGEFNNANYQYDAIGQLISDEQEGITNINWRVDGKVESITKDDGTITSFEYDGLGNRISKTHIPLGNTSDATHTYYIRDAQGNVMAVYNKGLVEVSNSTTANIPSGIISGTETYQANQDIIFGGNGTFTVTAPNGNITVEAGNSITLKPETHIESGAEALLQINQNINIPPVTEIVGLELSEHHIYGSSRLGIQQYTETPTLVAHTYNNTIGDKRYELSNHLGNVLSVISDRKLLKNGIFTSDVLSYNDYYPFGQALPGRSGQSDDYRYGFNGFEKDDEVKGSGNSYTTEWRQYDPRIGRWLSIDPVYKPFESPYVAFSNNPMYYIDRLGDDPEPAITVYQGLLYITVLSEMLSNIASVIEDGTKTIEAMNAELDLVNQKRQALGFFERNNLSSWINEAIYTFTDEKLQEMYDNVVSITEERIDEYERLYSYYNEINKTLAEFLDSDVAEELVFETEDGGYEIYRRIPNASTTKSQATNTNNSLHKNNNKYKGHQGVYEIKVNGKTFKYGKADMTNMSSTGLPRRLQSQINKLKKKFPGKLITGKVIFNRKNITTKKIKEIEAKTVRKYVKKFKTFPKGNVLERKAAERKKKAKRKKI
ncbi:RHS repeat-associated core domain-containing protein [Hyunsoonleella ulvae]|uniref:RHS repeat-associated core domain-containing protein n=1 Tax=Hyunsoonleella ulvae TaxID=2799948 RepID=UPI00193A98A5|nr:RHS repeat-associated core domain-containing protein [Hyunsoonleella ulvae]